jgi:OOP family OmpA-OmpF porin
MLLNGDEDNDGVFDHVDKCLATPAGASVQVDGCEIVVDKEVSITLSVLFPNNSSIIGKDYKDDIVSLVTFMHRHEEATTIIEGHSSRVGSETYNQFLSERRARSIVHMLIHDFGVNPCRLQAIGYGEGRLKVSGDTDEAHAANRRIESKVSAFVKDLK